jgi:hypothetical protein
LEKQIYRGTRRWLDPDHPYCSERMKCHFNVETEDRPRPRIVTMEEQIQCTVDYEAWKAAGNREGGMGDPSKEHGVKRLSIIPIFV